MLLQIFLNASEGFIFAKKRFSYNYRWVSSLNVIMGIITPIFSLMLIYFFGLSYLARILAPFIVSIAFILPHSIPLFRRGQIFNRKIYKHLFYLSIPMLPHFIFLSLMANGDKIIISHILGSEAVGTYSIAYSVAYILMPLTQGASSSLFPWLTRHSGKECKNDMKVAFDYILPFSMLLAGAFLLITPELYLFVGGEKFKDGLASVYPLSLSVIFLFLANLISSVNACHKKRYVVISTLISFLVGASCVLPFVNALGIIGGAIASLLAYITLFSLNLYFSYKSLGFLMINAGTLIVSLLLIGIYAPISFISRTSLPLRIILLVILALGSLYILIRRKRNLTGLKKGVG
jgi:O-antigen/teichoic acid export membrane protein